MWNVRQYSYFCVCRAKQIWNISLFNKTTAKTHFSSQSHLFVHCHMLKNNYTDYSFAIWKLFVFAGSDENAVSSVSVTGLFGFLCTMMQWWPQSILAANIFINYSGFTTKKRDLIYCNYGKADKNEVKKLNTYSATTISDLIKISNKIQDADKVAQVKYAL